MEEHPDLFTAAFWQGKQRQLREGREEEVVPYSRRFPR
jgi:isocitrate dehydrogenase kinase/phosphatase